MKTADGRWEGLGIDLWRAVADELDVDFELRERMLAELDLALESDPLRGPGVDALLAEVDSGLPKLWLLRQALHLRQARPDAFGPGADYRPLVASGGAAGHVVAFLRGGRVATIVPRLWWAEISRSFCLGLTRANSRVEHSRSMSCSVPPHATPATTPRPQFLPAWGMTAPPA